MNLTLSEINLVINETKRINEIHAQEMKNAQEAHRKEIEEINQRYNRQLRDLSEIHQITEDNLHRFHAEHLMELRRIAERKPTLAEDFKEAIIFVWACIYNLALILRIAKPVRG